jgi:transcriptional regulator with XRE-family HTH domain
VAVIDATETETIGERLRRLRMERGASQRELSGPGVSYAYISRIEAGSRRPSVKALRVLAEKLDVTPEYLERGSDWTGTDYLLARVTERLRPAWVTERPPLLIDARDPHNVEVRWRRIYAEPDEDAAAAGLRGGLSDAREDTGGSLTEALMRVIEDEDAFDRADAERVRVLKAAREVEMMEVGRPLDDEQRNDDFEFEV